MGVEIQVNDLTKSFGKQLIWGDVTLTVPAGEICVMLGPSGTGKSVFLKTLIGLLKPDKGSIIIEGTDIASCSEQGLEEHRLAGPRRTEHHADLARRHRQRHVAPDELLAKRLGEVVDLDLDTHSASLPAVWPSSRAGRLPAPRYY